MAIQVLSPLVAERIAAGEVIERPFSVVKELVENSIDAQATRIEIEISKGGIELIQVTDNGIGMNEADLTLSLQRHATSKIQTLDDLTLLKTLGFRGEALPSIASVADLKIITRAKEIANSSLPASTYETQVAHSTTQNAQPKKIANISFLGAHHGTQVTVHGLFSKIPARLKFLKSPSSETTALREMIEREALAHPEVSFILKNEGRVLCDFPKETFQERAQRILTHDDPVEELIYEKIGDSNFWCLEIAWLKGLAVPHTRNLLQVINDRPIRDRIFQQALLLPLKQNFLPGNFPVLAARLTAPGSDLDVNAHPTKLEVRFLEPKKLYSISSALIEKMKQKHLSSFTHSESAGASSTPFAAAFSMAAPESPFTQSSFTQSTWIQSPLAHFPELEKPFGEYRGTLFATYLMFEKENTLLMIDQHAAHERIRYEKLKNQVLRSKKSTSQEQTLEAQQLLTPEVVKFKSPKTEIALSQLGFEVERFGEDSLLIRAIPVHWEALGGTSHSTQNVLSRLKSLVERIENLPEAKTSSLPASHSLADSTINSHELFWDETLFEKIAMEACRGSVKAGDYLSAMQAEHLVQSLFQCEHPENCPHGRSTYIRIQKNKFDEWFQRIV